MDYCALQQLDQFQYLKKLATHFEDLKNQKKIGDLKIKISGCINACGHHHVGNIGILGLIEKVKNHIKLLWVGQQKKMLQLDKL